MRRHHPLPKLLLAVLVIAAAAVAPITTSPPDAEAACYYEEAWNPTAKWTGNDVKARGRLSDCDGYYTSGSICVAQNSAIIGCKSFST